MNLAGFRGIAVLRGCQDVDVSDGGKAGGRCITEVPPSLEEWVEGTENGSPISLLVHFIDFNL